MAEGSEDASDEKINLKGGGGEVGEMGEFCFFFQFK